MFVAIQGVTLAVMGTADGDRAIRSLRLPADKSRWKYVQYSAGTVCTVGAGTWHW